mmetsp:Transcript_16755/g.34525  ORF Transcript_16755/g.34525 Transcript_16755/m.34525 type:complete len:217 (-) Transcript_16755:863-1513(-)
MFWTLELPFTVTLSRFRIFAFPGSLRSSCTASLKRIVTPYCLHALIIREDIFTCGERYVASILYSLPTAPSMAHPASMPNIMLTDHDGFSVAARELSFKRKSRDHARSCVSRLMLAYDFSIPITARSAKVEIPGICSSDSCMAFAMASIATSFSSSRTVLKPLSFRVFLPVAVEKTTCLACSSFSTTSMTDPILNTMKKADPRFRLHCPEFPNPHR